MAERKEMRLSRKNRLYAANVIVPLLCGLFIYLTAAEDTLVSAFLPALRSLLPVIDYPSVIRNFAADFLWAYALFFCLRLSLGDELCGRYGIYALLLAAAVALILECLQMTKILPGTFDMLDIITELTAAAVALLISNIIERRKCYEEKEFN